MSEKIMPRPEKKPQLNSIVASNIPEIFAADGWSISRDNLAGIPESALTFGETVFGDHYGVQVEHADPNSRNGKNHYDWIVYYQDTVKNSDLVETLERRCSEHNWNVILGRKHS